MSWEYELAKEVRRPAPSGPPSILEGKVVCCLMGQTVVILGRLGGTAWTIPTR